MEETAASAQPGRVSIGNVLLLMAGGAVMAVLFIFNPATSGFYPFCPLHRLTGWLCPGCGSLRAIHELLHGNVVAAFRLNALLVLALPVLAGLAVRWGYLKHRGRPVYIGVSGRTFWVGFTIVLLFGILRNF